MHYALNNKAVNYYKNIYLKLISPKKWSFEAITFSEKLGCPNWLLKVLKVKFVLYTHPPLTGKTYNS